MIFLIFGLLVLMGILKLFGKQQEFGCLLRMLIVFILWKTGILAALVRSLYIILRWLSIKLLYYGDKLTNYLSEEVFNVIFFI